MTKTLQFQTDALMNGKIRVARTGTGFLFVQVSRFADLIGKLCFDGTPELRPGAVSLRRQPQEQMIQLHRDNFRRRRASSL